jgi:hypothetical protein
MDGWTREQTREAVQNFSSYALHWRFSEFLELIDVYEQGDSSHTVIHIAEKYAGFDMRDRAERLLDGYLSVNFDDAAAFRASARLAAAAGDSALARHLSARAEDLEAIAKS